MALNAHKMWANRPFDVVHCPKIFTHRPPIHVSAEDCMGGRIIYARKYIS